MGDNIKISHFADIQIQIRKALEQVPTWWG